MANLVTTSQIEDRLRRLPPEKLGEVYDFVSYLLSRQGTNDPDSLQSMPATALVIGRDSDRLEEDPWGGDRPEEDGWEEF
jgi:hypothetical protein